MSTRDDLEEFGLVESFVDKLRRNRKLAHAEFEKYFGNALAPADRGATPCHCGEVLLGRNTVLERVNNFVHGRHVCS